LRLCWATYCVGDASCPPCCASGRIPFRQTSNVTMGNALWIVGISSVERLGQWLSHFVNEAFPMTVLGIYPRPSGWLYFIDLIFGLALVAVSEEIIFRRCARHVLQPYLGNGVAAITAASLVFGCYHWWAGLGNVVWATIIGTLLMLMFRRSVALWPVALAHYSADIIAFA
jgi:uncharacterized protein